MFPCFMKCGNQSYVVSMKNEDGSIKHYLGSKLIRHRDEDVPKYQKPKPKEIEERQFVKETSVFSSWNLDNYATMQKCQKHDMKYWKVHKFIKNEKDYKEVCAKVWDYYELLKNTHIEITATSNFPVTYMNAFTQFIRRANLIDNTFKQSDIDRLFIAVNFEEEE